MRKRVLVAEDFIDNRRLLKFLLEKCGYDVLEAENGFEAVKLAASARPDLILMDIAMPVMDGIQATQAIRKQDDLKEIPIVAVTAYGDFYRERALEAGCNDVIQKPVEVTGFGTFISEYL